MTLRVKLKLGLTSIVAGSTAMTVAGLLFASGARTEDLTHYRIQQQAVLDPSARRLVHG